MMEDKDADEVDEETTYRDDHQALVIHLGRLKRSLNNTHTDHETKQVTSKTSHT